MIYVRLLKNQLVRGKEAVVGDVVNLPDGLAIDLLNRALAEPLERKIPTASVRRGRRIEVTEFAER